MKEAKAKQTELSARLEVLSLATSDTVLVSDNFAIPLRRNNLPFDHPNCIKDMTMTDGNFQIEMKTEDLTNLLNQTISLIETLTPVLEQELKDEFKDRGLKPDNAALHFIAPHLAEGIQTLGIYKAAHAGYKEQLQALEMSEGDTVQATDEYIIGLRRAIKELSEITP